MYSPSGIARATVARKMRSGRVHIGGSLSPLTLPSLPAFGGEGRVKGRLEPLGAQESRQQVDEQANRDEGGEQDHDGSFHTLSQAATKANISPRVARPKRTSAGIQISRFIAPAP